METKRGETYNGTLVQCDKYMNVRLEEVVITSETGERFWKVGEVQLKGSALKQLRIQPSALQKAQEERPKYRHALANKQGKRRR